MASATPTLGSQILGHGVEECVDQPGLTAVEVFKAVQSDVGRPQFGPFHPVADLLQGGQDLGEHPVVMGLICFQDKGVGLDG